MDFSALFLSLLLSALSSSSSASFMLMERCWGRKCGLLLDTNITVLENRHSHLRDHLFQYLLPFFCLFVFFLLVVPLSSILLHFSLSPPTSERDAGQSAVNPSFGKISQPLPNQSRQPQPTQGKNGNAQPHSEAHTSSHPVAFSDSKSQIL